MGPDLINLYDYEALAKRIIPHNYWDAIAGAAQDGVTLRRNRSAFEALSLRPRFMRDVSQRDLTTTVLGSEISLPVMVCPAGAHIMAHPEAEVATARGAGMARTLMMLSTSANRSLEDVAAAATGPLWFQLYHHSYELTKMLVQRAERSSYRAICLTIDVPFPSPKECDLRNRLARPGEWGHFRDLEKKWAGSSEGHLEWEMPRALTWEDLKWLRGQTSLPLVLKGVMTAEDAQLAVEYGVNGILVSNHGGRLLDMTLSSIETLPEVIKAVNGKAEVYLDSGIRRGSDVLKALALGARAVAIGRPLFWGLAVNGAEGVQHILEILRRELDLAMGYCGQTSVRHLELGLLDIPSGWGPSDSRRQK